MKSNIVAIVAIAAIVGACAPASKVSQGQSAQGGGKLLEGVWKADQTVAEVYAGQDNLLGTVVNVRGKVVKFGANIMGKNWIHLQDGSGAAGTNDLTVTTMNIAKVGDIVLVSGKITQNKDFGSGYRYPLIVEDAKVLVERK